MAANATQGMGTLVFLVAFMALGCGLFVGGNILLYLLFVVGLVGSGLLFVKGKAVERTE